MSITIKIGGIDVTDAIDFRSIAIEQHQEVKGDTLSCNMRRYDSTYDAPVAGKEIIVTAGSTKEFGGVILEVTRRQREGNSVDYELRCSDYVYYLDRRHLNDIFALRASYPNGQSIDGIMSAMLDSLHVLAQNDNAAPNKILIIKILLLIRLKLRLQLEKLIHYSKSNELIGKDLLLFLIY